MARPKTEAPPAEAILALADAHGRLAVKVTPGARVEMLEIADGKLVVKTRAKPKDGEATDAVLALIAGALGIARSRVSLLRGATSREKLVQLS
ncbi:DUF167 domain-containing protein [Altererythrobacter sp. CC-YST694]|uniref:DUF167 domain-containing protein n=1 Tax=Altererythrobacter sp. CC-YST694 TaxID=2755038 RepID=UPI001D002C94|nr:DUF167 domain-containing protein [Altererythrobacter sp. CC-YST694]MCB5425350.1 DUF167 domain-containing protein [Altererythrobacter sp. CC-YST694]